LIDIEKINDYRNKLVRNKTFAENWIAKLLDYSGIEYYFQYPIVIDDCKFFILDFYIPSLKLYLEIDGKQHRKHVKYDLNRKDLIHKQWKLKEIRISNKRAIKLSSFDLIRILTSKNKRKQDKLKLSKKDRKIQMKWDAYKLKHSYNNVFHNLITIFKKLNTFDT
jgi:very-short-patch-repair endonuclease